MKKRLMAAILVISLSLMLTAFDNISAASSEANISEAVLILRTLGIMDGLDYGAFDGNQPFTRAQAAVTALKIMKIDYQNIEKSTFSDVPENHWAKSAIEAVVKVKVLQGMGDGKFYPDSPLTYAQAAKIFVICAGYREYAEGKGGWPGGYIATATDIKIFKGISRQNGNISMNEAVLMAYNTLNCNILQPSYSNFTTLYSIDKEQTILSKMFNITRIYGVLSATENMRLGGHNTPPKGSVMLDNMLYKSSLGNIDEFFGCEVKAFIKDMDDDSLREVVCFVPDDEKNIIVTIKPDRILGSDGDFSSDKVVYLDQNKEKKYMDISFPNADVVYNGSPYGGLTADGMDYKITNGSLKLIDNNSDGNAEVVLINSYHNIVASAVDTTEGIIYGQNGGSMKLFEYGKENLTLFGTDGNKADISSIKEWNVVSAFEDGIQGKIKAYICGQNVKGKIQEQEYSIDKTVTIDGVKYELSKDVYGNPTLMDLLSLGNEGTFYLDISGDISGIDIITSSQLGDYAYLLDAAANTGLDSDKAQVKVFTSAGKVKILDTADKVKLYTQSSAPQYAEFTGSNLIKDKAFHTDDKNNIDYSKIFPQVVRIKTNGKGELSEIYFAAKAKDINNPPADYTASKLKLRVEAAANYRPGVFAGSFVLGGKTVIFGIPENYTDSSDDKDLSVLDSNNFVQDNKYNIDIYDLDDANIMGAMAFKIGAGANGKAVGIVENVSEAVGEDNEKEYIISLFDGTSSKKYSTTSIIKCYPTDQPPYAVTKGDLFYLGLNKEGKVDAVDKLDCVEQGLEPFSPLEDINSKGLKKMVIYGTVKAVGDNSFTLENSKEAVPVGNLYNSGTIFTIVDKTHADKLVLSKGSAMDLIPKINSKAGSAVAVIRSYDVAINVFIFRNSNQ